MNIRNLVLIVGVLSLTGTGVVFADNDVGPAQAVKLMQAGKVKPFEELNKTALAKHPGATIEDTELDEEYSGYVYEVELRDEQGIEWNVELAAASGEVIHDYKDD